MNYRRQHLAHALLMATAIHTVGCSSTFPLSRSASPNSPTPHYATEATPLPVLSPETAPSNDVSVVGYADPIFDDATLDTSAGLAPVHVASMLFDDEPDGPLEADDDESDGPPEASDFSESYSAEDSAAVASSMTLAELESLALANNPSIQELFATAQKAAGYRTQVGLRANPVVGYNGTQLADAGTDQHTAFISQTIITAGKLALNRRVLDAAKNAQLLQLEAQESDSLVLWLRNDGCS